MKYELLRRTESGYETLAYLEGKFTFHNICSSEISLSPVEELPESQEESLEENIWCPVCKFEHPKWIGENVYYNEGKAKKCHPQQTVEKEVCFCHKTDPCKDLSKCDYKVGFPKSQPKQKPSSIIRKNAKEYISASPELNLIFATLDFLDEYFK